MSIVIDASIALSWCFDDEATVETDAIAEAIADTGCIVPMLFHLEIANVLLMAERRGRLTALGLAQRLDLISRLPIETDHNTTTLAGRDILTLAREHRLTVYDAAYLELALRLGFPIATKDTALAKAARFSGLSVRP